ncbi:IS481 family transposase [Patulibacter defluvii]|uniref:IS481 family transposase n=1 Tax=Patulibacter defluvii TaxID=3095358 RepID=UPI002A74AD48|nr:IS481 family transposase [Patulibacter sp. DM4]
MDLHANAALTLRGRRRVIEMRRQQRSFAEIAQAIGASERCCRTWWRRWQTEGDPGLRDRSSRPERSPNQTPPDRVDAIRLLRGLRFTGPEIAEVLTMPVSTVSRVLKREGLGKLGRIGLEPAKRFEVSRPGEVLHIDTKKLGRIQNGPGHRVTGNRRRNAPRPTDAAGVRRFQVGWEAVHVAIDGHTRLAYAEVLPDEKATTTIGFIHRALAFYARHGITVQRIHSDNGSAYRSTIFALHLRLAGIRHTRSRAYRPQTNGKAERFIRTLQNGWAYGAIYGSSTDRTAALDGWLDYYNHRRPHAALGGPPGQPNPRPTGTTSLALHLGGPSLALPARLPPSCTSPSPERASEAGVLASADRSASASPCAYDSDRVSSRYPFPGTSRR